MSRFGPSTGGASSAPQPVPEDTWEMGGSYQCQKCEESVHEARYSPDRKELVWQCPRGHVSIIGGLEF